jgi:hypothetical protein
MCPLLQEKTSHVFPQKALSNMYSGRLTEEFVVEKLGHKFFDHVSELDLSSNKIRDTANCITGEIFGKDQPPSFQIR